MESTIHDHAVMRIGDLARQSGVSISTIRAWEQRYGLLRPARSPGGHRRYGLEDLRRINAVRILVREGVSLAAAAERVMGSPSQRGDSAGDGGGDGPLPSASLDPGALEAAYRATRSLLHITSPEQAVDVLVALVRQLGGDVVPAEEAGPEAIPLDLSLGQRPPFMARADRYSIARLNLERVLPTVLEDARRAAAVARGLLSSA